MKPSFRREQQLHCGEKASAKKKNSWKAKGGRVSKKYEVSSGGAGGWKTVSPELLSTSPESPVHGAAGPRIVVSNSSVCTLQDTYWNVWYILLYLYVYTGVYSKYYLYVPTGLHGRYFCT